MPSRVTHFEVFGEEPEKLVEFYGEVLGWRLEQMPGIRYWRIQLEQDDTSSLNGGLTYRAIPGLNSWLLHVNVESIDDTVEKIKKFGGAIIRPKTAVPRTAWVTIVSDPAGNMFGVWQADSDAFPLPEPD